jgi:PAS domain S-box-containing protein
MGRRLAPHPRGNADDIAVERFRQGERLLQELLGGTDNSIMLDDGQLHLLPDAQELLRQSELRFRHMFAASVTGMAISSPRGRFLEVNAAYCRILGYTREEVLARNFAELTHPDDLQLNLHWRDEILAGRRDSFVMEKRYRKKDGSFVWVNHSVSATRTETGEVGTFVVVAEDITVRRAAEEKTSHLVAIVESSADAIISEDLDGNITSWNRGATELFGYAADEIVGTSIRRLIPAGRQDEETRIIALTRQGESLRNFDTLRQAKDGRSIDVSLTASPIKNAAGEIVGLSKLIHDTTATRKSAARFRRLVESNAQGVFFWSAQGNIRDANDAFLSIIGYSREDLLAGRIDWIALTPPEYAEPDRRRVVECFEHGFCKPFEKEYIRKDGTRVPVLVGAAVFDDNRHEGVAFVVDLTERRRLEQQFRQAQKMEAIGNLAGGVAHDFNNVLAVIHIQADILKSAANLAIEQRESIEDIIAAVERAAALTRQLLLFSSREAFQPQVIDLSGSITSTMKMLRRLVGAQIDMQFKMASAPMILHADPGMMDQVLVNLVVNARDAMLEGGHLVVETSAAEFDEFAAAHSPQVRTGAFVCLSVSDSGCGIPPEHMPRIFEPFFTTKPAGRGTGLGLATVFGIVRQHQGWINVFSEVGHGTTFRIYLPRLDSQSGPHASTREPSEADGGSETILLVEDDSKLRVSISRALATLGYKVLQAQGGLSALKIWKEHRDRIHLVLTDLVMPGNVTGRQLAQSLLGDNPSLKISYMSGYSVEVVAKDFPLQEGVDFITKPFAVASLAKMVRRCLDAG